MASLACKQRSCKLKMALSVCTIPAVRLARISPKTLGRKTLGHEILNPSSPIPDDVHEHQPYIVKD